MMYWHFVAYEMVALCGSGNILDANGSKRGRKGSSTDMAVTNTLERFGRLSKSFIIFDANDQTP